MRKTSLGFILILSSVALPALAQETANTRQSWLERRLETIFASRAPAAADKKQPVTVIPESDADRAVVVLEEPAARLGDCPPVDPSVVRNLIRKIAAEEGIDAELAEAVAAAESGSGRNPGLSSAGAAGVMQLMPGTASDLGVQDRCDPEANIRGGIRYLKQMLDEFEDPILMLAAYNAGPESVYRESGIPLNSETVKYVATVLNHWKYSRMLDSGKGRQIAAEGGEGSESEQNLGIHQWKDGHVIDFN